ncbi:hypothetical protein QCA50_002669 [Cerrena zonata]|uniref:NADH dehydrogenase [ubiquinone] 1 beta subcomplex subunit 4 n=1 Tax=Cerrena zonata TaxID=2478898 RepID=A0AAW0GHI5_9APHY
MAGYMKKDPAIERWVQMKADVYKHFRWTSRTSSIAIAGMIAWPAAVYWLCNREDVKWSWRGKRKGESLAA